MIHFVNKLFKKQQGSDAGIADFSGTQQQEANFSSMEKSGFSPSNDERYEVNIDNNSLVLDLKKANLFAWTDAKIMPVQDVIIEAFINYDSIMTGQSAKPLLGFPKHSAGFLFKKLSEQSFLYCMVSSHGELRLDAVINGEPRPILPWIPCSWLKKSLEEGAKGLLLSIILRGKAVLIVINGQLALEAEDDSFEGGIIAFAAQSYDAPCSLRLESLSIDTRPMEVEAEYLRYARVIAGNVEQRRNIAEGFFKLGYYIPALIQIKKIREQGHVNADDCFLEAECYVRLKLYDNAFSSINECLALDPKHSEAQEEYYNLLYINNKYFELVEKLLQNKKSIGSKPRLLNLLGHGYYGLANWEKSAEYYGKAAKLAPDMPIYMLNKAEALDKSGEASLAAMAFLEAGLGFYEQEAWEDAALCSARLREKGYEKNKLDALDGMIAWAGGDVDTADKLLSKLWKKDRLEAPAAYIYGLILNSQGKKEEAAKLFSKAVSLEPQKHIYRYRLAEALFYQNDPKYKGELEEAIKLGPKVGWTANLAGQAELRSGNYEQALYYFKTAVKLLADEHIPAINLSEAFLAQHKFKDALKSLAGWPKTIASAANQEANIFAAMERLEEAISAYKNAIALWQKANTKDNPMNNNELYDYLVNLAAALLKAGQPGEAEAELKKALQIKEDSHALGLMGDIAKLFGDSSRAELAYRAAIEMAPGDPMPRKRLAEHYLHLFNYDKAKAEAEKLNAINPEAASFIFSQLSKVSTEKEEKKQKQPVIKQKAPKRPSSLPF